MTEYQRQRKLLRDYLSRQRRKNIEVKTKLPKYVKNPTEKSVERLMKARETAKEEARVQREKKKKSTNRTTKPKIKTDTIKTPESDVNKRPPSEEPRIFGEYYEEPSIIEEPELFGEEYEEPEEIPEPVEKKPQYEKIVNEQGTFYVDLETGEVVHAKMNEHYIPKDGTLNDHILDTYAYSQFKGNFSPNKVALKGFFDNLVYEFGADTVAQALVDASSDGVQITRVILYSEQDAQDYMDNLLDYIPEAGEFTKQSYLDLFGNIEDWNTEEDRELFESRQRG